MRKKENTAMNLKNKETATANSKRSKIKKNKVIKIEILQSVAGRFGLSANTGDIIEIDNKQGDEMVAANFAKHIK